MAVDRDWNQRYREKDTPWDSQRPSRELREILDQSAIPKGRALEFGCGTGTNAIFLAEQGFDVTAIDVASSALEIARRRAATAGVNVEFLETDVQDFGQNCEPFQFLFDRGCYHCVRRVDMHAYREMLKRVSAQGTWFLCLCGNANEAASDGPPRVTEAEIRDDLGDLFEIERIREFRFEDKGGTAGPLGWSVLMRRH